MRIPILRLVFTLFLVPLAFHACGSDDLPMIDGTWTGSDSDDDVLRLTLNQDGKDVSGTWTYLGGSGRISSGRFDHPDLDVRIEYLGDTCEYAGTMRSGGNVVDGEIECLFGEDFTYTSALVLTRER